ncbi:MAG: hypothetical protein ACO4CT_18200 [Planctomycetota bacterium]
MGGAEVEDGESGVQQVRKCRLEAVSAADREARSVLAFYRNDDMRPRAIPRPPRRRHAARSPHRP